MKTYTLKLKTTGTTDYNLYDGTTLVTDAALGTLFGSAGEAYFVFDFNSLTPTNTTALTILDSNSTAVITNTGLTGIAEDKNFKGTWPASATAFDTFVALTGVTMDEAQLTQLMGIAKSTMIKLTSADVNYHSYGDVDNVVALWKLKPGVYRWERSDPIVMPHRVQMWNVVAGMAIITDYAGDNNNRMIIAFGLDFGGSPSDYGYFFSVNKNTGNNSSTFILGAPYTSAGVDDTKPMSQKAATSMVYADPSTRRQIRLGSNATSSGEDSIALGGSTTAQYAAQATAQSSIAIGTSAVASEKGAIALGDHSSATIQGQVSINTSYTGHGYNNSNYRLLTGLYDGQSAHDAATYGQLNTRLGGMSIVSITQTDYDNLGTKDPDTLYVITGA